MDIRHPRVSFAPIHTVFQAHIFSTRDEGGEIFGIMRGAGPASEQNDGVVHQSAVRVLKRLEFPEEVGQLLTQEAIVLGELELAIFIPRM